MVTGCSWVTVERIMSGRVSDTTLRGRRDEWIAHGVFDELVQEAIEAYDRIVGLDLSETAIDGSQHKHPAAVGVPEETLLTGENWAGNGLFDRPAWDTNQLGGRWRQPSRHRAVRTHFGRCRPPWADLRHRDPASGPGIRHPPGQRMRPSIWNRRPQLCKETPPRNRTRQKHVPRGQRWPIERTNSWLSNYGQLRRNTDRSPHHRLAPFALAITLLIAAKLIDWRNRYTPTH